MFASNPSTGAKGGTCEYGRAPRPGDPRLLGIGRWVVSVIHNVLRPPVGGGGAWPGVWWVSMKRQNSDFIDRYHFPEAGLETITLRRTEPSENGFERNLRDLRRLDACAL